MDWQPIETAPRDIDILVYNPFVGVYSSRYYIAEDRDWSGFPVGFCGHFFGSWYPTATHWMPLPEPPKLNSEFTITSTNSDAYTVGEKIMIIEAKK